jgi:hypothetical protein
MTNKQDITVMSSHRDLTPGPSPKERGEGHDIRRQPPLSFGGCVKRRRFAEVNVDKG